MQKILADLLQSDPQISVIGTARDGEEALRKIANLHPDVVTLDIEMPRMDGLTAVKKIMKTTPLPVVMISALTQRQAQLTLKALELGAVDYVPKPSGPISLNMDSVKTELITKIKTAASANVQQVKPRMMEITEQPKVKGSDRVISIAASTGGPAAVTYILKHIPENTPPILIVQHMQKGMTRLFAEGLNQECKFKVKEAEEGDVIQEGLALIAPGGLHMQVTKSGKISLTANAPVNYVRPSADVLMASAAEAYESKNIGVVLTGMGVDGAKGIEAIKKKGGVTIAQDRKTCVVFGMPYAAIKTGCVDCVAPLECIPKKIMNACEE
ncbi:chemotaxis response regulator protein-glutamate methylesterase [Candidatus Bathyarchaeota archaeon A05DMB-2]|jgi:two-component system chemotaxis response regulator CheB|nr:chemotaxis response regulator protein-glutamate methylesterase [Candidatus Bathyarchaeota archaeon A05DMB-2]